MPRSRISAARRRLSRFAGENFSTFQGGALGTVGGGAGPGRRRDAAASWPKPGHIDRILRHGSERASAGSQCRLLREVQDITGLLRP